MFRWLVLLGCLFGIIIGLVIGVMNPQSVNVYLPGLEFSLSLGGLLMLVFAIGVIAGLLIYLVIFHLPWRVRHGRKKAKKGSELSGDNV